jgi:hypothetical protein
MNHMDAIKHARERLIAAALLLAAAERGGLDTTAAAVETANAEATFEDAVTLYVTARSAG